MARSKLASLPRTEAVPMQRLLAFSIVIEVPDTLDDDEAIKLLDIIESQGLEQQALTGIQWHLREKKVLNKATARLER